MDKHFGMNNYSLWHLFRDEQRKVIHEILQPTYQEIESAYREIYENHYPLFSFLCWLETPLPDPFRVAAGHAINTELRKMFENDEADGERIGQLIEDARKWAIEVDRVLIGFFFSSWVSRQIEKLIQGPEDLPRLDRIRTILGLMGKLLETPNLWKAQNLYFSVKEDLYGTMRQRAEKGEEFAKNWAEGFRQLGNALRIKVS
jgi:hypothetical protein